MNNETLYREIVAMRKDIKELQKEFYIFKGKAFGFLAVVSVVINLVAKYLLQA